VLFYFKRSSKVASGTLPEISTSQTTINPRFAALNCKKFPFIPKNDVSTLEVSLISQFNALFHLLQFDF
jgi:hypothetical protein